MEFKFTKYVLCRVIDARDVDLFVYGHSFLHFYMPDDIEGREL